MISDKKSAINLIGDPFYMTRYLSLVVFTIYLSLSLTFVNLIMMCLNVNCFGFILLEVHWVSPMCKLILFSTFGNISPTVSLILFLPLSFALLLGLPLRICWYSWWKPTGFLKPCSFSFSYYSSHWVISIDLSSSLLITSSANSYVVEPIWKIFHFS